MPASRIMQGFKTASAKNPITATLLPKNRLERVQNSAIAYVERELSNGSGISISRQGANLADRLEITSAQISKKAVKKYGDLLHLTPESKLAFALPSDAKVKRIVDAHQIEAEFAQFKKFADAFSRGIR